MARGRKTMGADIADTLPGSALAQKRIRMILATLSGEIAIAEACEELGINEARFHKMRREYLEQSIALLEPKRPGRKPKEPTPEEEEIQRLQKENADLGLQLEASRIRTEIALTMPHLLKDQIKKNDATPSANPAKAKRKKRKRK